MKNSLMEINQSQPGCCLRVFYTVILESNSQEKVKSPIDRFIQRQYMYIFVLYQQIDNYQFICLCLKHKYIKEFY